MLSARDCRARGHPHRSGEPADAGDLHAVRGAGAGGRGRRPVPVPDSDRRGRHRHRHAPVRGVCPWRRSTPGCPRRASVELVPLIVILVALVVVGAGDAGAGWRWSASGWATRPGPARCILPDGRWASAVGVVALLVTAGSWRAAVIGTFIAAVIGLSLVVVTGYAGQVSLAQLALAGAAAFTLSGLTAELGRAVPVRTAAGRAGGHRRSAWWSACRPCGSAASRSASSRSRSRTPSRPCGSATPTSSAARAARVTPPSMLGIDLGIGAGEDFPRIEFGLLCLFTLVAVAVGVAALRRSALGSAMLAVRANERSAAGGRRQRRAGEGRSRFAIGVVHRGPRRQPARLPPAAWSHSTPSPPSAASPSCRPRTSPASPRSGAASTPGSCGVGGHRVHRPRPLGRPRATWFQRHHRRAAGRHADRPPGGHRQRGPRARRQVAVRRCERRTRRSDRRGRRGGGTPTPRRRPSLRPRRRRRIPPCGSRDLTVPLRRRRRRSPTCRSRVDRREDRRADRPERCRQDERHRRHHRLRAGDRDRSSLPGSRIEGLAPHAPRRVPGSPARFQQLELYDDLIGGGERQRGRLRRSPGQIGAAAVARALHHVGISALRGSPGGRAEPGRTPARVHRACLRRRAACAAARRARRGPRHRPRARGSASGSGDLRVVRHRPSSSSTTTSRRGLRVCDHVYVLDSGAVIAEGTPDTIRSELSLSPMRTWVRCTTPRRCRHERPTRVPGPDGWPRLHAPRSATLSSTCRPGPCSRCSDPTVPASRPCCSRSPGCSRRAPAPWRSTGRGCATATPSPPAAPVSCWSPTTGPSSRRSPSTKTSMSPGAGTALRRGSSSTSSRPSRSAGT